ncbi:hypothetical protein WA588_000078, partial [Blastocystis sp. NMH]
MGKKSAHAREDNQPPIHPIGTVLPNKSCSVSPDSLLGKDVSGSEYSFPQSVMRKTEVMRNPGLLDEMEYLHLVFVFSEKSRRCIHCNSHDASPESPICSLCKATFFFNPKLENAYKYCDVCHDFHYFMFFLSDDGQSFHPECVVSSIPVRPSFHVTVSCVPLSKRKMQCSEDVMDVLQSCGILQHVEDHCTHCGCLWSSQDDSEFCLRCRSHFFFSIPPSLSPSPKRVRLTNQRQLTYCWCETCETFHWLASFRSPHCRSFLPRCHLQQSQQAGVQLVSVSSLPTDETTVLRQLADWFVLSHVDVTQHILRQIRGNFGHSLRGRCVLCLKRSLDSLDPPNRTAVGKRVTDRNRGNESLVCSACEDEWFSLPGSPRIFHYCSACNLFHTSPFFFDSSSQNYRGFCSRQLVETAWLQGLLSQLPRVAETPSSLQELPLSEKALSRCRSPFSLQLLPAISARCRHCRRLFPMRPPAGICEFCRNHWFSREDRPYHFCEACGSFHWARYFFDATSGRFSEVCLPSQLNHRRQRAKERENRQKLVVSEEAGAKLPSRAAMKLACARLTLENPHERLYTGMMIACIMEELWRGK